MPLWERLRADTVMIAWESCGFPVSPSERRTHKENPYLSSRGKVTYRRESRRLSFEKVDTQGHAIAVKPIRVIQVAIMGEQLLPDDVSEMSKQCRLLLFLQGLVVHLWLEAEGRRSLFLTQ